MSTDRSYRLMLVGAPEEQERLGQLFDSSGQAFVVETVGPDEVGARRGDAPDVAVLADLPNPLPVARFLRDLDPASQILFLVNPDQLDRFRQALPFVPNLASAWTASSQAEPAALTQVVEEAAWAARDRRAVSEMVGQINRRLAGQRPAAEQRHSQLAFSERYLATILTQSPDAIVAVDRSGIVIAFNEAAATLLGPAIRQERSVAFLDLLPDEERAGVEEAFRRALDGEIPPRIELRLAGDGRRFAELSLAPVQMEPGSVGTLSITARDISERKRAEEHQRLLINELNHRVKNTLAIVQALAQQSFKGKAPPEEERNRFEARLGTLAAAHSLLTRRNWESVSLADLAREATAGVCGVEGNRFLAHGPEVTLPPQSAVTIGMALHELCTNAIKYGALSTPGGTVSLTWSRRMEPSGERLRIEWIEQGGPRVEVPSRRGFGSRMIERGLAAELDAEVQLNFEPNGVVCIIDAPFRSASTE